MLVCRGVLLFVCLFVMISFILKSGFYLFNFEHFVLSAFKTYIGVRSCESPNLIGFIFCHVLVVVHLEV